MKSNREVWRDSRPDTDLFHGYMKFLGIEPVEYEGVGLRLHPDLRCDQLKKKLPAMVACLANPANKLVSIHCTYLMENWHTVTNITAAEEPAVGSSVRLFSTKDAGLLIVATKIETALAARAIRYREHGDLIPCWATLNAQTMEYLVVPERIRKIIVAVDNDVDYTSQRAGYALANRLMQVEGRKVRIVTPDKIASNFSDELMHTERQMK